MARPIVRGLESNGIGPRLLWPAFLTRFGHDVIEVSHSWKKTCYRFLHDEYFLLERQASLHQWPWWRDPTRMNIFHFPIAPVFIQDAIGQCAARIDKDALFPICHPYFSKVSQICLHQVLSPVGGIERTQRAKMTVIGGRIRNGDH